MYEWDMETGKRRKLHPELKKSAIVREIRRAIGDEDAAVELVEKWRWGGNPTCPHCGSGDVYRMKDAEGEERNIRRLWRCHECKKQYTVRIGTVMEHSRLSLSHWIFAFWRAGSSKKGISALELQRQCQITYRAAHFLMNRIRWAIANPEEEVEELLKLASMPDEEEEPKKPKRNRKNGKLGGIVEADETYVGGRPRNNKGHNKRGRGTKKVPVFAAVERYGSVRACVVNSISGKTLKGALREMVSPSAIVLTDELSSYNGLDKTFEAHHTAHHGSKQYARPWPGVPPEIAKGDSLHTNTIESFFGILKRGITGIYHSLSVRHLHRYVSESVWRYNVRDLNDGDRTVVALQLTVGKRLTYREYATPHLANQATN